MPRTTFIRCLALASALAAAGTGHAADVRIDGRLQAAYTYFDTSAGSHGGTVGDDKGQSRIGVQAGQQVGDGFAALGRAEVGLDPDTFGTGDDDGSPFRAREAWVGMQWPGGQLRGGRLPGAYKQVGGIHWDLMNATELQQRRAGGLAGGDYANTGFLNSLAEYRTPPLGGFEFIAQYGFDDRSDDNGADRNGDDFLLGAIYREGPWELIGAYSRDDSGRSGENRNWKLGVRFDSGEASLAYHYEKVRVRDRIDDAVVDRSGGGLTIGTTTGEEFDFDTQHHMVGVSQMYGTQMLWIAWGYMDADDNDYDIQNGTLALTRFFSQGFQWYTGVQYQDRGRGYDTRHMTVASTGVRFDF